MSQLLQNEDIPQTMDPLPQSKNTQDLTEQSVLKHGLLVKRGNASCACQTNKLYYYVDESALVQGVPKSIAFERIMIKNSILQTKGEDKRDFVILSGKTKLKLRARNEQERDEWVEAIKTVQLKLNEQDKMGRDQPQKQMTKLLNSSKISIQSGPNSYNDIEDDDIDERSDRDQNKIDVPYLNSDNKNDVRDFDALKYENRNDVKGVRKSNQETNKISQKMAEREEEKAVDIEVNFDDIQFVEENNQIEEEIKQNDKIDLDQSRNSKIKTENKWFDDVENPDPHTRGVLPYMRDPKQKVKFWTFLKDCIGKDLTRISMPVYFNHPLSIMQKMSTGFEYSYLLDEAAKKGSSLKRMAFIGAFLLTFFTHMERFSSKPFNPLLAETFELIQPTFKAISEAVSHHPLIVGMYVEGNSGYVFDGIIRPNKPKFSGGSIKISQYYKQYLDFKKLNEKYEISLPPFSIHNIIFGKMYMDVSDQCVLKSLTNEGERLVLKFSERKSSNPFGVAGEILDSNNQVAYKLEGKWNQFCDIIDAKTGEREKVWEKTPYPDHWDFEYGFTQFQVELNYLPNFMEKALPPTDSRLRPDQRALENGDMKLAVAEKDRLENKQRLYLKYLEHNKIEYKPAFFDSYKNPNDKDEVYYKYNGTYWEKDRKERNWDRLLDNSEVMFDQSKQLSDIYSENLPAEIQEFSRQKK